MTADRHLSASEITVVTPTKGRHKQLARLLETLSEQTAPVGQILIADGGADAADLVASFAELLPVKWLNCPEPGQIPQRNFALTHLNKSCRVVIYFDDDMQLERDAVEQLVTFWNAQDQVPAGVSFNITNMPKQSDNVFRRLFLMATTPFGRIWKSGYNSPVSGIAENLQSDWLIGGATAWRRDILVDYRVPDLPSVWAICEDLIFSYPVSKHEKMFVCADAKVRHIDDERVLSLSDCITRGRSIVLWRYYFITRNPELSKLAFLWMNMGLLLGRFVRVLRGNKNEIGYAVGSVRGLGLCLRSMASGRDILHDLS